MSKTGFALCLLYMSFAGLCIWTSITSHGDPKGSFVLLQLPLAFQFAALDWIGLGPVLSDLSWVAAYSLIGLPTLVLIYAFGWALGRSARCLNHRDRNVS